MSDLGPGGVQSSEPFVIRTHGLTVDDGALWNEASAAVFSLPCRSPVTPSVTQLRPVQLRHHELSTATAGFNPRHLIASGTYGQVYVAALPSLNAISKCAIKRVQADCGEDVMAEVELLSKCAHPNLLPLLGYSHGQSACLVFPLMSGGTLEDRVMRTPDGEARLHALGHSTLPAALTWWERVRILRDAMRGLEYLHRVCKTLHSDVKPSNILLDKRLNAYLADFGLALSLQQPQPARHLGQLATANFASSGNAHERCGDISPQAQTATPAPLLSPFVDNTHLLDDVPVYDDLPCEHASKHISPTSTPMKPRPAAPTAAPKPPIPVRRSVAPSPSTATFGRGVLGDGVDLRIMHRLYDDKPTLPTSPSAPPSRAAAAQRVSPTKTDSIVTVPPSVTVDVAAVSDSFTRASLDDGVDLRIMHRLYDDKPAKSTILSTPPPRSTQPKRILLQPVGFTAPQSSQLLPVPFPAAPSDPPEPLKAAATVPLASSMINPPSLPPASCAPSAEKTAAVVRRCDSWTWVFEGAPQSARPAPSSSVADASSAAFAGITHNRSQQFGGGAGKLPWGAVLSPRTQTRFDCPPIVRNDDVNEEVAPLPRPRGLRGTKAFLDPLYVQPGSEHSGRASEMTDGYAMGLTTLVTVTGLGPTGLVHQCRHMLMNPDDPARWQPPAVPSLEAGAWPKRVACGLIRLVVGLTWEPLASRRIPLATALKELEVLAATVGVDDMTSADF